jgi:transposase
MKEMEKPRRWFAGVDWATQEHQVCLIDDQGTVVGERAFAHSGTGLADLCRWLVEQSGAQPDEIWVSIEIPHGAVVETLLERGFVAHSINPKQLDRFRDRFTVAGAKDDRRDAYVLADSLRTDGQCFRRLQVDEPTIIELREWSRMAEDLQGERVRLANQMREQLRRYYPQALELAEDIAADWFLALWEVVSTPAKAVRVHRKSVEAVLKQYRIRKIDAAQVLERLRQPAVTVAPGTEQAATVHIHALAERIRLVNRQTKECHQHLDRLCEKLMEPSGDPETSQGQKCEQRDVEILRSLPGVGRIVLATLLAEASQPLRQRDYHALRSLSGAAPVTRRSGKRCVVVMRKACHMRLRGALYHWARVAIQHDPVSRARYAELRGRGHSHGRALRSVGDRLLAVACAMLRTGTLFDKSRNQPKSVAA